MSARLWKVLEQWNQIRGREDEEVQRALRGENADCFCIWDPFLCACSWEQLPPGKHLLPPGAQQTLVLAVFLLAGNELSVTRDISDGLMKKSLTTEESKF